MFEDFPSFALPFCCVKLSIGFINIFQDYLNITKHYTEEKFIAQLKTILKKFTFILRIFFVCSHYI